MASFQIDLKPSAGGGATCGSDGCGPMNDHAGPAAGGHGRPRVNQKSRDLLARGGISNNAGGEQRPLITVDVWSDVICPWCYYGKAGLDAAMRSMSEQFRFAVRWHPFLIRPNIPRDGHTAEEAARKGHPVGTRDRPYWHKSMKQRAMSAYGLDMGGKVDRFANPTLAHCLMLWALRTDASKQHELQERIFRAYYAENRYVGSVDVLLQLAGEAGYSAEQVVAARAWLESGAGEAEVFSQYKAAARRGLSGVPDFTLTLRDEGDRALATRRIHGGAHSTAFEAAFGELRATAAAST